MADQIETTDNGNIAPNIDTELDAALNKSFTGNGAKVEQSPVVKEVKATDETRKDPSQEPVKQEIKSEVKRNQRKLRSL